MGFEIGLGGGEALGAGEGTDDFFGAETRRGWEGAESRAEEGCMQMWKIECWAICWAWGEDGWWWTNPLEVRFLFGNIRKSVGQNWRCDGMSGVMRVQIFFFEKGVFHADSSC